MTAPPTDPPAAPAHRDPAVHAASPGQLHWLEGELRHWQAEGLVDTDTATAIRGRYVASRRFTLSRIVLTLGACFVGLGLIWLVASNLQQMSPLVRFLLMVTVWIGLVVASELLAARRARSGDVASPVVGAVRLLAAGAFGAVVFQAAQSLQVPAYEPLLVGVWGLGAILWAYTVRGVAPLVLGIGLIAFWFVWEVLSAAEGAFAVSTALAAAALAGVSIGVGHGVLGWREFAAPWREIGAALALVALFVAALPYAWGDAEGGVALWVGLGVAVLLAIGAAVRGDRLDRFEVGLAALSLVLTVGLSLWRFDESLLDTSDLPPGAWARAVLSVVAYLLVASGYAVLGGMRDTGRLTWLATAALVVFVTVQAFAVFAPVVSGAALFLIVGIVLLGTGVLADRGRRRLVSEAKEALS
ncbi:hypothetical protein GCM10023168_04350 [Fodinibacter luteus]|uniref:DUF2157 domain-containing protein n=1 Tax=Fodinibacter luteus TaxID=552064 RepID=A0ABP8K0E2_9MICO